MSKKVAAGTVVRMTAAEKEYLLKRLGEEAVTTRNGTSHKLAAAERQADAALRAEMEAIPDKIGVPGVIARAEKLIVSINKESNKLWGRDVLGVIYDTDNDRSNRYSTSIPREKNDQGEVTAYGKLAEAARRKHMDPIYTVQKRVAEIAEQADDVLREFRDRIMFSSNPDAMAGILDEFKTQVQTTRLQIEAATKTLPLLGAGESE